jgi:hypothetical protein
MFDVKKTTEIKHTFLKYQNKVFGSKLFFLTFNMLMNLKTLMLFPAFLPAYIVANQ